ncbi:hypothetical protein ACOZE3_28600 [Streptomyces cinereoruber]|uniref:hypothetical protein n=1 Tax=Streptomyces cinereoruber TaxID=67260 RepID=UPI003BF5A708
MTKLKALPHVPRWAVVAAHAVPLLVLPSGVWRVALTFGAPVARIDDPSTALAVHQIVLTVVAELLVFLTPGLVREWGEVFPHRPPFLGGRPVGVRGAHGARRPERVRVTRSEPSLQQDFIDFALARDRVDDAVLSGTPHEP